MSDNEYTPTMNVASNCYAMGRMREEGMYGRSVTPTQRFHDEFDRWLAERDREAEARGAEQERERIVEAIEAAGRSEVTWLKKRATDNIDHARIVGADDAWNSAIRIARGEHLERNN